MGLRFVPLLFVAVLCTSGYASLLSKSTRSTATPAFVWTANSALQHTDDRTSTKVIYEDVDTTALINKVWSAVSHGPAAEQHQQQSPEDALLVFVGNQLDLKSISSKKAQSALQSLQDSMQKAGSALSIPALATQGSGVAGEVVSALKQKTSSLHTSAACSDATAELEDPATLLQTLSAQQGSEPKTAVVCVPAQADWTLAAETAYLDSLSKAAKAAYPNVVMAYMSDSTAKVTAAAGTSRSLLQSMELPQEMSGLQLPSYAASLSDVPDTYLCDDKCFTQVRVIEVVILFITILTALLSGICMLNVLGTPTKFETAKDARQSHD